MATDIFVAEICDEGWYVKGPLGSPCFGYYGGTLDPSSRFAVKEDAQNVARMVNIAYAAGQQHAKEEIRNALGL